MSSLVRAWGNSWDLDALSEPISRIQATTVPKIFAVLQVSCSSYGSLWLKLIRFLTWIFAVFLQAGGLQTLIFTMRSQQGGAADRTDITNLTYLWPFTSITGFLHTKIGKFRGLGDAINPTKFCVDRLKRFGSTGGRISGNPIVSANGPYHVGLRYSAAMTYSRTGCTN
jgi:hypothetical protein